MAKVNQLNMTFEYFFDRQAVIDALTRAERKALSKFGAYVRQTARSSILDGHSTFGLPGVSSTSPPGHAPYSHTGLLKKWILFEYEPLKHSVVIGPRLLNDRRPTTPEVLEHGGHITRKGKLVYIAPRPYMAPAMSKELNKFVGLFGESAY